MEVTFNKESILDATLHVDWGTSSRRHVWKDGVVLEATGPFGGRANKHLKLVVFFSDGDRNKDMRLTPSLELYEHVEGLEPKMLDWSVLVKGEPTTFDEPGCYWNMDGSEKHA